MVSDENILRLLYFLLFILSFWSSSPRLSFNHTFANFENKNKWIFWMFSAASQIVKAELSFGALYLYSESGYSLPCLFISFAWVMLLCQLPYIPSYNILSMKFSWWGGGEGGVLHTFQVFILSISVGMGRLRSCVFVFICYWWKKIR